jgi:membrane protein
LTAALFEVGKFLIGLYIGKQGLESTYGAAASIVVMLIWVYYSAQLVLMGAEFTNVYARRFGSQRNADSAARRPRFQRRQFPSSLPPKPIPAWSTWRQMAMGASSIWPASYSR